MKKKHQKTQIILISIGIFLILTTYFFYPYMKKTQFAKDKAAQEDIVKNPDENRETLFENIQYKGIYDLDKTFTVNSENAHILKEEPDIVYITNMHVINRIITILCVYIYYNVHHNEPIQKLKSELLLITNYQIYKCHNI